MSTAPSSSIDLSLGLEGHHVLITGGAGHIGRVVVAAFLSAGSNVTSLDIAHKPEDQILEPQVQPHHANHPKLLAIRTNITDPESVKQAFDLARLHLGDVHTCVCLAGLDLSVLSKDGLIGGDVKKWRTVLDVNVIGSMVIAQAWLAGIQRLATPHPSSPKHLSLILCSSEAAHFGTPLIPIYATSKAALHGLLRSLAEAVPKAQPYARVNAVAPGPVDTPRFREECAADPHQFYVDAQATVPRRMPVPVEDVAKTCVVLASGNMSGSVHGQVVRVDGGKTGNLVWREGEVGQEGSGR
ncbi:NAD(P)-binding protein [Pseudovirgaria hyperparasitica]|uniref:NAD(P)-binding protein n=1 Tax=Pseudovirgaria hyperparasitica TaxID=470096 RepID=A0A6A6VZU2_9PEZI|nr:NAD(P)-binding protein [Pseudovirgaria hyperparasitica]KAF2754847.1 NAD(P)-binding protein [Pseudovirgaria hyperparasitica]